MKRINLNQRSDEWLVWRTQGITASETPVILGLSPYQTRWRLWAEKTGFAERPDLSGNPNVQRGIAMEDDIRELIAQEMCDIIEPACAEWDEDPLFRASFDGLTTDNVPVEIKAPSVKTFEDVKANGENATAYKLYYPQVQHQILVADAKEGWLCFFCNDELLRFHIQRDEEMIQRILTEGRAFWDAIVNKQEPDLDPERDIFIPKNENATRWVREARAYRSIEEKIASLKKEMESYEKQLDGIKSSLKEMMGGFVHADFAGVSVRHSFTKGRVDYKKAYFDAVFDKEKAEELSEKFRTASSERWLFKTTESATPKGIIDEEIETFVKSVPEVKTFWW